MDTMPQRMAAAGALITTKYDNPPGGCRVSDRFEISSRPSYCRRSVPRLPFFHQPPYLFFGGIMGAIVEVVPSIET